MTSSDAGSWIADFWKNRIKWGLRWGLIYAVFFGALVIFLRVVDGPSSFQEHGTSVGIFLEAYLVVGIIGGLIAGIARPFLHSQLASGAVGLIIGAMTGFTLALLNHELGWSAPDLLIPVGFAFVGCVGGLLTNRKARKLGRL